MERFLSKEVKEGNIENVRKLLQEGEDVNQHYDEAIILATQSGNYDMVKLLLDNGADPNANSEDGQLLSWACLYEYYDIVKLLIEYGADVDAGSGNALKVSIDENLPLMVKLLIDYGADVNIEEGNLLKDAIVKENYNIIQLLIPKTDLDAENFLGIAANIGNFEIFKLLVDSDANYNRRGILASAIQGGNYDIVNFLLQKGVDPSIRDVVEVVTKGDYKIAELVLDYIDLSGPGGDIPLSFAVGNDKKMVEFLLEKGATPRLMHLSGATDDPVLNYIDKENNDELMEAIVHSDYNIADLIIRSKLGLLNN